MRGKVHNSKKSFFRGADFEKFLKNAIKNFFSTNLFQKINELDKDYEETTRLSSCFIKKPFELPAEVTEDTSVRYFTAPYMSSLHKKFEFLFENI